MGYKAPYNVKKQFKANGCNECYYTGYSGRTAIYEVIPINHEFAGYIKDRKDDINPALESNSILSLSYQAFNLFTEGQTSLEEVYPILLNSI
jgi:general secretion pathway protein E/type IV pilus assembly protein PilB